MDEYNTSAVSRTSAGINGVKPHSHMDGTKSKNTTLPLLSAVTPQQRNPLALNSVRSKATAVKSNEQGKWRSALLEYEVSLKELLANNIETPPSGERVMRTFQIYDAVTRVAEDQSPELMDLLKMFRVEFCRAIFARQTLNEALPMWNSTGEAADKEEDISTTYFEQVDALLRENAALRVEVDLGNTRDNLASLNQQVERLTEMVGYFENEVARLERENERTTESCQKTREELNAQIQISKAMIAEFDEEKQRLLQENKDMQLRLCRMRKYLSDRESTVVKDAYKLLKARKMEFMNRLFDEGDERVSLLVMLSQLESRINEALDAYDRETLLSDDTQHTEQQQRMLDTVSLLLEEMHLCESRYVRLAPRAGRPLSGEERDETDGFVALVQDTLTYESIVARVTARSKKAMSDSSILAAEEPVDGSMRDEVEGSAMVTCSSSLEPSSSKLIATQLVEAPPGTPHEAPHITQAPENLTSQMSEASSNGVCLKQREVAQESLTFVRMKQDEWVTNIFGASVETTNLLNRVFQTCNSKTGEVCTQQEHLLRQYVSRPLLDVNINKFQCGIDLYAGPGPLTQVFLCSVMHIDPVNSLHVPQGSKYMQIKYRNLMRKEIIEESTRDNIPVVSNTDALEEWGGKTVFVSEIEENEESNNLVNASHMFSELKKLSMRKNVSKRVSVVSSSTPIATVFERLNPLSPNRSPEWLLYQNLFGGYRVLTPRLIDISYIDHILLNACVRHFERMEERYARCLSHAKGRATNSQMTLNMAERFFKDAYVLTDFQEAVVQELESRYCFPELVAKTLYEILCFLDASVTSQPLVDLYLSCIRGFESPTRIHYITYVLYQLSINWPSSNPEEVVLREDVLTLLEYIYKRAACVTSMEAKEILFEYEMATRSAPITLTSIRTYLVKAMLHFEDPLLLYFNGLLSYKATSSSVVEMNFEKFETAIKNKWDEKVEGKTHVRYLTAACGFVKKTELTTKELACVATSMWSSEYWVSV